MCMSRKRCSTSLTDPERPAEHPLAKELHLHRHQPRRNKKYVPPLDPQLRVSNLDRSILERGPCGVSTASHHTRIFCPADLHTGSLNSRESLSTRITISGAVQQTRSQRSIAGDNWQVRSASRLSFSPSLRRTVDWHKANASVLCYG